MEHVIPWTVHVLLPLVSGSAIYALYREYSFVYLGTFSPVHNIIAYNLPDGLWQYSFSSSMLLIWKNTTPQPLFVWFSVAAVIGLLAEIAQYFNVLCGTFDLIDICFVITGAILPLFLIKIRYEK